MLTIYILVKHLDSDYRPGILDFTGCRLTRFDQGSVRGHELRLFAQDELFPTQNVQFSDWLLEREYAVIPPSRSGQDPALTGDTVFESEDLLLALRLYKPGDVCFAAQTIRYEDGSFGRQHPYRYFAAIGSTHPYYLDQHEILGVERILALMRTPTADSNWFKTAKRFFLYGGAKEFNPYQAELDRIVDYTTALEAVLAHGSGAIGGVLRRRACALLGLPPAHCKHVSKLVSAFYGRRSALTHGSLLSVADPAELHREMWCFEGVVRDVLRTALAIIPADPERRIAYLDALSQTSDEERIARIRYTANEIQDASLRAQILSALGPR